MAGDSAEIGLNETAVFEKYDGDIVAPEFLRERITTENGVITKHEFFDEPGGDT